MGNSNLSGSTSDCKISHDDIVVGEWMPLIGDIVQSWFSAFVGVVLPLFKLVHMLVIPRCVFLDRTLSIGSRVLIGDLLSLESHLCWKSRKTLSKQFGGVSHGTITRWWGELLAADLVEVRSRRFNGGLVYGPTKRLLELLDGDGGVVYIPRYLVGRVSLVALMVAGAIQSACGEAGWARRGIRQLAEATGLSKGAVQNAVNEMVEVGVLVRYGVGWQTRTYAFLGHDRMMSKGMLREGAEVVAGVVERLKAKLEGVSSRTTNQPTPPSARTTNEPGDITKPRPTDERQEQQSALCAPAIDLDLCSVLTRKETEESSPPTDHDLTSGSNLPIAPFPPNCAAPPSPVAAPSVTRAPRPEEVEVWAAMRSKADELGYAPTVMTPNDAKGAEVLLEAGGADGAQRMAVRLSELWESFRRRFRALESYPVPNLGAIPVISPILGALERGDEWWARPVPRVVNANGVKLGEFDPLEAVSAPIEGW